MTLYRWALVLFFFSGATGLVYEIFWTRRLSLTFGHSVLAVSTVVTAYMGGLALGSWVGGRWTDRRAAAPGAWFLRSYGQLELLIGGWGLLSLPLLSGVEKLYFGLASGGWSGTPLHLAVFALSMAVLVPPTTAMGATLPILSGLFSGSQQIGVQLSRLYASNTWGAMLGAALAGFVWLPWLGLRCSVVLAALGNLLVGSLALALARTAPTATTPVVTAPPSYQATNFRLPLVFALSGAASMCFQLGWTRGLSLFLGSSVYAFTGILSVFLAGIAAGSWLYSLTMKNRSPSLTLLAGVYAVLAVSGAASLLLLAQLPNAFLQAYAWTQGRFAPLLACQVGLIALVLALPTLCMGLLFPLVTHLYHQQSQRLGGSIGTIYGANTLGCILGSFLAGFFLLPQFGVQATIQIGATCCLLASLLVRPGPLWLLLGVLCWSLPAWDRGLASAGVAISAARDHGRKAPYYPPPVFYRDGISCSVAVVVTGPGQLSLRVNGKADASLQLEDRLTQTSLGLIPLLYQAHPKEVAVIGLGSGLTLTALADSPEVQSVECAELEPAVIECQPLWAPFNRQILSNPKVQVKVADGRTLVLSASKLYDIIVSEPSNPWIAGIGNLYTLEFYQACRNRLQPHGCFVQWCNLYALSAQDLELVVRTFYSAFPHGDIWTTGGDLVLVGSNQPTRCHPDNLALTDYLRTELPELGFWRREELAGQFLCSREQALRHLPAGPVNSDDLPRLEYSAPRSLYRPEALAVNLQRTLSWRTDHLPAGWPPELESAAWWGQLIYPLPQLLKPVPDPVIQKVARQELSPDLPPRALLELARRALARGEYELVLKLLQRLPGDYAVTLLRAQAHYAGAQWRAALECYRQLLKYKNSSEIWSALASCEYFLNLPSADESALRALEINPFDPRALYIRAELASRSGQLPLAEQRIREVTRICPYMINAWTLLARLQADQGRTREARKTLERALRLAPDHPGLTMLAQQLGVKNRP